MPKYRISFTQLWSNYAWSDRFCARRVLTCRSRPRSILFISSLFIVNVDWTIPLYPVKCDDIMSSSLLYLYFLYSAFDDRSHYSDMTSSSCIPAHACCNCSMKKRKQNSCFTFALRFNFHFMHVQFINVCIVVVNVNVIVIIVHARKKTDGLGQNISKLYILQHIKPKAEK